MGGKDKVRDKDNEASVWDVFNAESPPSVSEKKPQEVPAECLQRIQPMIKELFVIETKIKNSKSIEEADHLLSAGVKIRVKIKQTSKEWFDSDVIMPESIRPLLPDIYEAIDQAYLRITGKARPHILRGHPAPQPSPGYLERIKPLAQKLSEIEDQIKKSNSIEEVERLLGSGTEICGRISGEYGHSLTARNPRMPDGVPPRLFEVVNQAYIRITGKERPDYPKDEWFWFGLPGEKK